MEDGPSFVSLPEDPSQVTLDTEILLEDSPGVVLGGVAHPGPSAVALPAVPNSRGQLSLPFMATPLAPSLGITGHTPAPWVSQLHPSAGSALGCAAGSSVSGVGWGGVEAGSRFPGRCWQGVACAGQPHRRRGLLSGSPCSWAMFLAVATSCQEF